LTTSFETVNFTHVFLLLYSKGKFQKTPPVRRSRGFRFSGDRPTVRVAERAQGAEQVQAG